jgi:hypothetical protein
MGQRITDGSADGRERFSGGQRRRSTRSDRATGGDIGDVHTKMLMETLSDNPEKNEKKQKVRDKMFENPTPPAK